MARLDRLPSIREVAQLGAVLGREFAYEMVQAIVSIEETKLQEGLAQLVDAELLYQRGRPPRAKYIFKHALVQDAAYQSLLKRTRQYYHRQVAELLERRFPETVQTQPELVAYHAVRGELWEKAVPYFHRAGIKAAARSAYREAVDHFEQALTALGHLPQTCQMVEQAIDLHLDLRSALQPLGELENIARHLREAERLAVALDDQGRLGWTCAHLSGNLWMIGHLTEARAYGETGQAIATTLGDVGLRLVANYHLGLTCIALGEYLRAEELLRGVVQSVTGDLTRERFGLAGFPAVMSRSFLARSLGQRGEFREGISFGQEAVRIAESLNHPYSVILARRDLGYLYGLKGDFGQAVSVLETGLKRGRKGKVTLISATVTAFLGHVYALSGAVTEGIALLKQGLEARESMGAALFHSLLVVELGEAYALANRPADAQSVANRALALARERGERGYEAWAVRLLGELASRLDSPEVETSQGHYCEALALAEELGMRPLVAQCHLGLGRLCGQTGKRQEAVQHLNKAAGLFREMDMRFWLQQAEAQLEKLVGDRSWGR
jgi:tetratricopeptide (TPR) repeat protein